MYGQFLGRDFNPLDSLLLLRTVKHDILRVLEGLQGEGAAPPMALWSVAEEIRAIGRVLAASAASASSRPLAQVWREARVCGRGGAYEDAAVGCTAVRRT